MSNNQKLYEASMTFFLQSGVPVTAAEKASTVVAKDDPCKSNFDRTEEDQKAVSDAMTWMNAAKTSLLS